MHAPQCCFAAFYHGLPTTCDHSEQAGVADPRPEANSPQMHSSLLHGIALNSYTGMYTWIMMSTGSIS